MRYAFQQSSGGCTGGGRGPCSLWGCLSACIIDCSAGGTECVPEIKSLKNTVDIAFLPIDGVYTMTPEEAAQCYLDIMPKVSIPYHQGTRDPNRVKELLAATPSIKVEIYPLP